LVGDVADGVREPRCSRDCWSGGVLCRGGAKVVQPERGQRVSPSATFLEDLCFFRAEAVRWNGVEVLAEEPSFPRGLHAASDAAGAGALSVALFGGVFVWDTPLELEGAMLQFKELLAAVMMDVMLAALVGQPWDAREGGTSGQETRVLVSGRIDNQNCLAWFAKGVLDRSWATGCCASIGGQ
jgi:hypothetical protein